MPLPNIQPPISNDIAVVNLGNNLLDLKRSLTARNLTDIITNYTGFPSSGSSYIADETWLHLNGSTFSHIGPSSTATSSHFITDISSISGGTNTVNVNFTDPTVRFDAKGHMASFSSSSTLQLSFIGDTWCFTSAGTMTVLVGHASPQTNSATFAMTAIRSVSTSGSTLTINAAIYEFDNKGHFRGTHNTPTTTSIITLPTLPGNDGTTYVLTVNNGALAWVASAACP